MIRTGTSLRCVSVALSLALLALPARVAAQAVSLEIRPRVGDTLSVRMDQMVEMTGLTRGDTSRMLAMETSVFSRAVPLRGMRNGTLVEGYADSVVMSPRVKGGTKTTRRLGGRSTQMLIQPDGAVDMLKDEAGSQELREFFGQMPAMLPGEAVSVGKKWTREMPVPLRGDVHGTGWVKSTFALDSISRNGDLAYLSLRGLLSHERLKDDSGVRDATGTINGTIQLNRRLGWITDSRVTIVLESVVHTTGSGSKGAGDDLMQVRTKIVQRVRAVRK